MKKLSVICAIFFLTIPTVFAERIIQINTTGQPPLNTLSQQGFMDEVAAEAFKRIGYKLQTQQLPAERGLKSANNGVVDGEMSRVKGLEKKYNNLIRVPEKIMDWEFVVFSYNPIRLDNGWKSLSEKSVGHINGWKILENSLPNDAEITKTTNSAELFKLLKRKRADFVIYELWGGRHKLRELSMSEVKLCQPTLSVKEMFIYLHKKHEPLIPQLSSALRAMKKDGSYDKLVNKHLKPLE